MNDIFEYEKRKREIGKRIKALRKEKKLSQDDLADCISHLSPARDKAMGQPTISSWERGITLPPIDKMIALATVFDCDIAYLLGDYEKAKKDKSDICDMTGLSEKALNRIMAYKEQYPNYIDSLNYLVESDHFENTLFCIYAYSDSVRRLNTLRTLRHDQIENMDDTRVGDVSVYKEGIVLLSEINERKERVELCEYNLSTQFGFIVQELKKKFESEIKAEGDEHNG